MWLKLCFLLLYVVLLFVLARFLEALAWCELDLPGLPSCFSQSCRLLDPVLLSVVQLKSLLDQRGLSYEGVVEKSELTELVGSSGQVNIEEVEQSQIEVPSGAETNFTSGAHFIEQVEDAKDSVWLVQVSGTSKQGAGSRLLGDSRWKNLKRKMAKFGMRMGYLDCSLDTRYCRMKNWHSDFVLLALPSQHQKKASVAMYNFSSSPLREASLLRWVRDKLDGKVERITNIDSFTLQWQHSKKRDPLEPEVRAVLFTTARTNPLFYSALSVKFPGRVKFGLVVLDPKCESYSKWRDILNFSNTSKLPDYVIYTAEGNYSYGFRPGEYYSFTSMERFLKFLYPCLNDIFIISFCLANAISWLEPFVSNCGLLKRFKKFAWCILKYNLMVILLWLPLIGIFQMPYLDRFPLLALKCVRIFSMSNLGQTLRGDYNFYFNHSSLLCLTFALYTVVLTVLCKKFRSEEIDADSDWFNFSQMRTLTHLRPNDFFEPMRIGGYDLLGGLDVFGSRLSQPSLWLPPPVSPEYIQHLPTWTYYPTPLSSRALMNVASVEATLASAASADLPDASSKTSKEGQAHHTVPAVSTSQRSSCLPSLDQSTRGKDRSCLESHCLTGNVASEFCCPALQGAEVSPSQKLSTTQYKNASEEKDKCSYCKQSRVGVQDRCARGGSFRHLPAETEAEWKSSTSCSTSPQNMAGPSGSCVGSTLPSSSCCTSAHIDHRSEPVDARAVCPPEAPNASEFNSSHLSNPFNHGQFPPAASQSNCGPHSQDRLRAESSSSKQQGNGFPAGFLQSHQCVICLEEYIPLTSLCGLPCGHVFHETCIISWLNRDKHFCPMCRWPSYRPRPPHSH